MPSGTQDVKHVKINEPEVHDITYFILSQVVVSISSIVNCILHDSHAPYTM